MYSPFTFVRSFSQIYSDSDWVSSESEYVVMIGCKKGILVVDWLKSWTRCFWLSKNVSWASCDLEWTHTTDSRSDASWGAWGETRCRFATYRYGWDPNIHATTAYRRSHANNGPNCCNSLCLWPCFHSLQYLFSHRKRRHTKPCTMLCQCFNEWSSYLLPQR